mmetsp:Transcript_63820/g.165800  ORF Transcript_63820/g.165800 Transcript_63820/m.165800 type:complete len:202 (-) Transcript_63820:1385-1990(-)
MWRAPILAPGAALCSTSLPRTHFQPSSKRAGKSCPRSDCQSPKSGRRHTCWTCPKSNSRTPSRWQPCSCSFHRCNAHTAALPCTLQPSTGHLKSRCRHHRMGSHPPWGGHRTHRWCKSLQRDNCPLQRIERRHTDRRSALLCKPWAEQALRNSCRLACMDRMHHHQAFHCMGSRATCTADPQERKRENRGCAFGNTRCLRE